MIRYSAADEIGVQTWQNKQKTGTKGSPGWASRDT